MSPDVEQGYLVLADVSGYTGFLAGTELEHATGILAELIQSMLDGLSPPLELAAVEGDAVFVHGPAEVVARGETLLELIEATYAAFRMRRGVMSARTTCGCGACSRIDDLDLKFVTHFGGFAWQDVGGSRTPVGTDVNVVHRLLKNGIESETGWRGYALFTDAALSSLGIEATGMHRRVEEYEHLGGVDTATLDLDERMACRPAAGVPPLASSHWFAELDLPAAPATVWEWLNDPRLRSQWVGERTVEAELPGRRPYRPGRRLSLLSRRQRDRPHDRRLAAVRLLQRGGASALGRARAALVAAGARRRRNAAAARRRPDGAAARGCEAAAVQVVRRAGAARRPLPARTVDRRRAA